MTATDSEIRDPATGNPAIDADDVDDAAQLARARDGILTDLWATLPDTESLRRLWITVQDFAEQVRSKEVWDIQPPSPRELWDRVEQGPWRTSDEPLLRKLAWWGKWLCLIWSVPLYTLAVLSQRFWRAFWAIALMVLIWNLT